MFNTLNKYNNVLVVVGRVDPGDDFQGEGVF